MQKIQKNIKDIYKKIHTAAHNVNRNPNKIQVIAVTKNQPINFIKIAISVKHNNFGENYAQEALKKIQWFQKNTKKKIIWHFIGTIQSNKSRIIAENFDWCHTIVSPKLIYRLESQRPNTLDHLNVLIQINVSNNQSKSGIYTTDNMFKLAKIIHHCSKLKLRGIMSLPIPSKDFKEQLLQCKKAYVFFKKLQTEYTYVDTLSLGMSDDMIPAIYAGSNMIRIGKSIFGNR